MIVDLKEKTRVVDNFLIDSVTLRKTRNGRDYMDFVLKDRSGSVNAKLWEVLDEHRNVFHSGDAVRLEGDVDSFNNALQIRIARIRPVKLDEKEMSRLVESAPVRIDSMFSYIMKVADEIENREVRAIVSAIMDKYRDRFIVYPAAKAFHHAYKGGLLYHTYTMLKNAQKLSETYDFLNTDLLYAGVIIHDVCKTDEMEVNANGAVEKYSKDGQLLGHIIMCVCEIDQIADSLSITGDIPLLLKHMVLSHHYHPEFGSPVKPMFPEAEMLHYLDLIDARMNQMLQAERGTKPNEMSSRIRTLDGRSVYNHNMGHLKEDE